MIVSLSMCFSPRWIPEMKGVSAYIVMQTEHDCSYSVVHWLRMWESAQVDSFTGRFDSEGKLQIRFKTSFEALHSKRIVSFLMLWGGCSGEHRKASKNEAKQNVANTLLRTQVFSRNTDQRFQIQEDLPNTTPSSITTFCLCKAQSSRRARK